MRSTGRVPAPRRPRDAGAARGRQDPSGGPVSARRRVPAAQHRRATKITLPGPFTLSQQAENAFYADEEEMAMDYAVAVNEELRELKAAGVDVVQLDEPWVRTSPEKATRYGRRAINRALEGIEGPTVVHLCFGYAAVVSDKPSGYSFPAAACGLRCAADLDRGGAAEARSRRAAGLAGKTILLGVLDLGDRAVETAETRGRTNPRRIAACSGRATGPSAGLRHEIPAARHRFRQAAGTGGWRRDRSPGTRRLDLRRNSLLPAGANRHPNSTPANVACPPLSADGAPTNYQIRAGEVCNECQNRQSQPRFAEAPVGGPPHRSSRLRPLCDAAGPRRARRICACRRNRRDSRRSRAVDAQRRHPARRQSCEGYQESAHLFVGRLRQQCQPPGGRVP